MFFLIKVPLAIPEALEVSASSPNSLRVRWQLAAGATQYMALYSALNDGEPDDAKEVSLGSCDISPCGTVFLIMLQWCDAVPVLLSLVPG